MASTVLKPRTCFHGGVGLDLAPCARLLAPIRPLSGRTQENTQSDGNDQHDRAKPGTATKLCNSVGQSGRSTSGH
eukprot:4528272-Alexandrium_andersonii.AAC.1